MTTRNYTDDSNLFMHKVMYCQKTITYDYKSLHWTTSRAVYELHCNDYPIFSPLVVNTVSIHFEIQRFVIRQYEA